jgi:hypothetical protein
MAEVVQITRAEVEARQAQRLEETAKRRAVRDEAKRVVQFESALKTGGFVYIVYCEHAGTRWHKIGVASSMEARLPVIQTGCPLQVSVLMYGWVSAARFFEKELHAHFDKARVSGEWFLLTENKLSRAVRMLSDEIAKSATPQLDFLGRNKCQS